MRVLVWAQDEMCHVGDEWRQLGGGRHMLCWSSNTVYFVFFVGFSYLLQFCCAVSEGYTDWLERGWTKNRTKKGNFTSLLLGIDYISFLFRLEFLFIFRIGEVYLNHDLYFLTYMSTNPIYFGFGLRIVLDKSYSNLYEDGYI
jgi:hypothetical protein